MDKTIDKERLVFLITRYLANMITRHELRELEKWMETSYNNQLLFAELLLGWNIKSLIGVKPGLTSCPVPLHD